MRQCQIQCNFWGIDDLCKLCKEYLIALTYFILDKILKLLTYFFWCISIVIRCKVIWSQKQSCFLAHPVYSLLILLLNALCK